MAETGKTFLARKIAEATQAAIEFEQVIPANVVWAGGIPRPICGVEGSIGKATNVVVEALDTALDPYYKLVLIALYGHITLDSTPRQRYHSTTTTPTLLIPSSFLPYYYVVLV